MMLRANNRQLTDDTSVQVHPSVAQHSLPGTSAEIDEVCPELARWWQTEVVNEC